MAFLPLILLAIVPGPLPSADQIIAGVVKRSQVQDCELQKYSVIRRYTLRNRHMDGEASLTVRLDYQTGHGKHFSVLHSDGPGVAQHALMRLVKDEEKSSQKTSENAINLSNYSFALEGEERHEGRLCYRLKLTPRKSNKMLIDGELWVDAHDLAVVELKGRPARSLSFWIGRPLIDQRFAPVNGFWMPSGNQTTAEVRLAGDTELNIEYRDYKFNLPAISLRAP